MVNVTNVWTMSIKILSAVPFKKVSLCLSFVKSFDMLPKQKLYQLMLSVTLYLGIFFLFVHK